MPKRYHSTWVCHPAAMTDVIAYDLPQSSRVRRVRSRVVRWKNGGVRAAGGGESRLAGLRRYTWWAAPGSAALILVVVVGGWLRHASLPAWLVVASTGALATTVVASVVLLSRRLATPPVRSHHGVDHQRADIETGDRDPRSLSRERAVAVSPANDAGATEKSTSEDAAVRAQQANDRAVIDRVAASTGWLVVGGAGAAVLAGVQLSRHEYGLWAVAPAILVSIAAAFAPPRRARWIVVAATAMALVPGTWVALATGSDRVAYVAVFPAGVVLFAAWVTLGPLWAWDVAGELERARELAAELAVKDERLRFAADLHDSRATTYR